LFQPESSKVQHEQAKKEGRQAGKGCLGR
jgi:hypothetical protein